MIANTKVEYKVYFNLKKTKIDLPVMEVDMQHVKLYLEQIGVEKAEVEIVQDLEQIIVKFVSLYAWKLVIIDRSFIEKANKILVTRL